MSSARSKGISSGHRQYERHPVSCEIDGDVFSGQYWVAGMILVVSTAAGGASRQLAGRQPEELARSLLRDFVLANQPGLPASPRVP